jgi:hypothetical protein
MAQRRLDAGAIEPGQHIQLLGGDRPLSDLSSSAKALLSCHSSTPGAPLVRPRPARIFASTGFQ